jgi:hypothetical protein
MSGSASSGFDVAGARAERDRIRLLVAEGQREEAEAARVVHADFLDLVGIGAGIVRTVARRRGVDLHRRPVAAARGEAGDLRLRGEG